MNPVSEFMKRWFKKPEPISEETTLVLHFEPSYSFLNQLEGQMRQLKAAIEPLTLEVQFPAIKSLRVGYPNQERNIRLTALWALSRYRQQLEMNSSPVTIRVVFGEDTHGDAK